MTTQPNTENRPLTLIDVHAIERQARAARSEMSREAFVAIASVLKRLFVPSRPAAKTRSHIRAWA